MSYRIYLRYAKIVRTIPQIPLADKHIFAEELERRHRQHRPIPISVYKLCKDLLIYKPSLGRRSPYYADLLSIEDEEDLKYVLLILYSKIRINRLDII